MSRKPDSDGRQQDFFGAPAARPKQPEPSTARPSRARAGGSAQQPGPRTDPPAPVEPQEPDAPGLHDRLARLSPAELRELTATLTDDALGQLTLAAIRQLKRRLVRAQRHGHRTHGNKGHGSSLERAAQQLVAEFAGQGDEDEF